ncbi:MAG: hypothetical protein KIS79_18110 [Burkholderiales bacterium]|nr:hypothetical protein [Burkholderiales bacterium]
MHHLRSYVVKVYRQQAGVLTGTVQEVQSGRTVPFQTMEELWQAIRRPPPASASAPPRRRTSGAEGDSSSPKERKS